jgi:hypothetical protein
MVDGQMASEESDNFAWMDKNLTISKSITRCFVSPEQALGVTDAHCSQQLLFLI